MAVDTIHFEGIFFDDFKATQILTTSSIECLIVLFRIIESRNQDDKYDDDQDDEYKHLAGQSLIMRTPWWPWWTWWPWRPWGWWTWWSGWWVQASSWPISNHADTIRSAASSLRLLIIPNSACNTVLYFKAAHFALHLKHITWKSHLAPTTHQWNYFLTGLNLSNIVNPIYFQLPFILVPIHNSFI